MDSGTLVFNGIDGTTGDYLLAPGLQELGASLLGSRAPGPLETQELRFWLERVATPHLGPQEGVDPRDLAQAGWGALFHCEESPAVVEALGELLEHRQRQATAIRETRFRVFAGEEGYRPGESKVDFLARHGVGPGPADPDRVPYYLLVVGDPEALPYRFQHQLDVQYAVGRLHLETPEAYARYASGVVSAETGRIRGSREMAFFGVSNADDPATDFSSRHLLHPLAEHAGAAGPGFARRLIAGQGATKAQLCRLLGGGETPALLFTTSHGMGFPAGDPRQLAHQGAFLCQDWPGPKAWRGSVPEEHYVSADDVGEDADPRGLISFHYACFGGGTLRFDPVSHRASGERLALAPKSFVSGLARRLLGHPRGGALAVVAHVGRAWGYSYAWPGAGRQLQVFESALTRLLQGHPVGSALDPFHLRYAELTSDLAAELEEIDYGKKPVEAMLTELWTAAQDARSYSILGDPAVRLPG